MNFVGARYPQCYSETGRTPVGLEIDKSQRSSMGETSNIVGFTRGLVGAVLGGVLGYCVYVLMLRQGFYALIVPGTLLGLGFGLFYRRKSILCGIGCGVFGVGLGIFSEWRFFPFIEDKGLLYFLAHLYQLPSTTIALILLGGFFAFWLGTGRDRVGWNRALPFDSEPDEDKPVDYKE